MLAPRPTSTSLASQSPSPALITPQTSVPRPAVEGRRRPGRASPSGVTRLGDEQRRPRAPPAPRGRSRGTRSSSRSARAASRRSRARFPPSPATAAQMPIAFGRSFAGKTFVRIESVVGMISAPPMPIAARVAISMSARVANADASEAAPNTTRPVTRARRRRSGPPVRPWSAAGPRTRACSCRPPTGAAAGCVEIASIVGSAVQDRVVERDPSSETDAVRGSTSACRRGLWVS